MKERRLGGNRTVGAAVAAALALTFALHVDGWVVEEVLRSLFMLSLKCRGLVMLEMVLMLKSKVHFQRRADLDLYRPLLAPPPTIYLRRRLHKQLRSRMRPLRRM